LATEPFAASKQTSLATEPQSASSVKVEPLIHGGYKPDLSVKAFDFPEKNVKKEKD
jgi:hypothetical protein